MGSFSIWHWLIVLLIIILVFGTKKLKNIGSDLGGAVKGFKDGMKDGQGQAQPEEHAAPQQATSTPPVSHQVDPHTIDVQAKQKI